MRRGDIYEITTITGRSMTALVVSDTDIANPIGYVFIVPIVPSPQSRQHVTTPLAAVDGHAILWRMQAVPADHLAKGVRRGVATEAELGEIDSLMKALLGLQ